MMATKTKVLIYNIFISQSIPIVKSGDEKRALMNITAEKEKHTFFAFGQNVPKTF